jgi:hypothetical protein
MNKEKKDAFQQVLKKADSLTPLPALSKKAYTAEEVIEIVQLDRHNRHVFYARYLQKI